MKIRGFRNLIVFGVFVAFCAFMATRVNFDTPDKIAAFGQFCLNFGLVCVGVVLGRGVNKWAEGKAINGNVQ